MINQQVVTGNWHQVKGEIQKAWSRLSGDDLERAKGNVTSLIGVIEKQYGSKKEDIMQKLENIVERFEKRSSQSLDEDDEDESDDIYGNQDISSRSDRSEDLDVPDGTDRGERNFTSHLRSNGRY